MNKNSLGYSALITYVSVEVLLIIIQFFPTVLGFSISVKPEFSSQASTIATFLYFGISLIQILFFIFTIRGYRKQKSWTRILLWILTIFAGYSFLTWVWLLLSSGAVVSDILQIMIALLAFGSIIIALTEFQKSQKNTISSPVAPPIPPLS